MQQQLHSSLIDLNRGADPRAAIGLPVHLDTWHNATTRILDRSLASRFCGVDCAADAPAVKADLSERIFQGGCNPPFSKPSKVLRW